MRCGAAGLAVTLALLVGQGTPVGADSLEEAASVHVPSGEVLEEPPRYGVYYDRYEPTFYTGFAPRALDPRSIHLHLGRGNQLRVTFVLSDALLESYAKDLACRYRTYRTLIDQGRIVLNQNTAFEDLEKTLRDVGLEQLIAEGASLSTEEIRTRNLALLERLNPGRIHRIRMPADEIVRRWAAAVRPADRTAMTTERRLELVNLMLPTRLWIAELDGETSSALTALVELVLAPEQATERRAIDVLRPAFWQLFDRVTDGIYPLKDGAVEFVEFTAIYPVGSFNEYTEYRGRKIPLYPTPGRRALTTHQRTKTVDHIPEKANYSYSPWIPYMHVGTRLHNSFHTLWWPMDPGRTSFLPPSWRIVDTGSRSGKPYSRLWLLSRGPMSHGCTHVNTGHIAELRQMLPAETQRLYEVDTYLNKSYLYDVFDIDGDFEPEVMGVRYFIAYSLRDKKPGRLRVRNERHAYYDWLYGGELQYDSNDRGFFRDVRDCHFIDRTAVNGATYDRIALHEATYEPEKVQFYRLVDIPFARELRKVNVYHPFPKADASGAAPGVAPPLGVDRNGTANR